MGPLRQCANGLADRERQLGLQKGLSSCQLSQEALQGVSDKDLPITQHKTRDSRVGCGRTCLRPQHLEHGDP